MVAKEPMRPLWRCGKCGHRFVTKNLWHSCGRYRLADHFKGNLERSVKPSIASSGSRRPAARSPSTRRRHESSSRRECDLRERSSAATGWTRGYG